MKNENKILLSILIPIFLFVIFFSYYNIFILGNYQVMKQIPCDPKVESCFVSDCEANDPSCDTGTTYKKISILSKYAGSDYDSLTCPENSSFCKIITCQDSIVEAGEKCFK